MFVVWVVGFVKVIFTGDMCEGMEFAMLCIMLLTFGLLPTGTAIDLATGMADLGISLSTTGEELDEFVRLRFRGLSSSSAQLTLLT